MDFLLDNALVMMDASAFLVLFASLITFLAVAVAVVRISSDRTDQLIIPAIPPEPDPIEIAFLRGGTNEAARAIIFSLLQKKLIRIETEGKVSRLKPDVSSRGATGLPHIEKEAINWIGSAREAREVFRKKDGLTSRIVPYLEVYQEHLERRHLLTSKRLTYRLRRVAAASIILLILVGGYRIFASVVYGHYNFVFTLFMAGVGIAILLGIAKLPRITKLGRRYLERLTLAFSDLKYRSQAPYISGCEISVEENIRRSRVDPLLLSVGLFGTGILAGTVFADYNTAFQRSQVEDAKRAGGGGCGSGSSCGSCSSSDSGGGGGCSSGCGGGGCGGGGCGG